MTKRIKKTKEMEELVNWVAEHRELSGAIERLLDAGWLNSERVADMIASHLMENPYWVNLDKNTKDNGKQKKD